MSFLLYCVGVCVVGWFAYKYFSGKNPSVPVETEVVSGTTSPVVPSPEKKFPSIIPPKG